MAEPFLCEIRIMSFGFAPKGWSLCNGALLPINQNQALFALLGTTYGGDGRQTFGLPNLQGRTPMHMGNGHTLGQVGGEQNHTLVNSEMPAHLHQAQASTVPAATATPDTTVMLAQSVASSLYAPADANLQALAPNALANSGGSQPHLNMQPFLTLNFCIALQGIFPSQN